MLLKSPISTKSSSNSTSKMAVAAIALKVLGAISGFAMNIILSRMLGAEQTGYFLLGITIITVLANIARCGMDNIVLKHSSIAASTHDWATVRSFFFKAAITTLIASSILTVFLWTLSDPIAQNVFEKPEISPLLRTLSPALIALSLLTLLGHSWQGMRHAGKSLFTTNIGVNLLFIIGLLTLRAEEAIDAALIFPFIASFVLITSMLWWHKETKPEHTLSSSTTWTHVLKPAGPLWVFLIMSQIIYYTGQLSAGAFLPPDQVAQLAIAQRIAMLIGFFLMAVHFVVAPQFAVLYEKNDTEGLQQLATTSIRIMCILGIPFLAVMLLFPIFMMGLFGSDFKAGAPLLQILAAGQFLSIITGSASYMLIMSDNEKDMRNALLLIAPLNIFITIFLTKEFGAIGCAISTAAAISAQNIFAAYKAKKRLGINSLRII